MEAAQLKEMVRMYKEMPTIKKEYFLHRVNHLVEHIEDTEQLNIIKDILLHLKDETDDGQKLLIKIN